MNNAKDRIRGCLIGGAAGDALGYAVEFDSLDGIYDVYGSEGIRKYEIDFHSKKALISDDTQMTMFTAAGILNALYDQNAYHGDIPARRFVMRAYMDWLATQEHGRRKNGEALPELQTVTLLMDIPELYSCRAPGNTCLSALMHRREHPENETGNYLSNTVNSSKGCGGVMRAAPVGLIAGVDGWDLAVESAEIAAITHGHPLGYMPAAVLTFIVNELVFGNVPKPIKLRNAINDAKRMLEENFANPFVDELIKLIDMAAELAKNDDSDVDNIRKLGQGWVGEEALAIALYCCLRHKDSFSDAIIAAVNHSGDSDSTGAIAGNIMGACYGYEAIEDKWKEGLELSETILELADDMAEGFRDDDEWKRKYGIR